MPVMSSAKSLFIPSLFFLNAFVKPADAVSHAAEVVVFEIIHKAFPAMNTVPGDGFAVSFFAIVFDRHGDFDKFFMADHKVRIKAYLFFGSAILTRILPFNFSYDVFWDWSDIFLSHGLPQFNFIAEDFA